MCGIAGIAFADPHQTVDQSRLNAMNHAILHRGPDGGGVFCSPGVGLAHRRLSIIDLAGGTQPLGNEDGSIQVVFNGEIYNYRELHRDLVAKGHTFHTSSDTEVLVHLYEEQGERLVEALRGMFAFAIWDTRKSPLLLARDRLGIKPLYFARNESRLLFCSELKGLLAYGDLTPEVDPQSLEDYLAFGMVSGTRSILRGIEKLAPGCTLSVEPGHWNNQPRRYWQIEFAPDDSLTAAQWTAAVRAKVEESVEKHLIADVPVGAFLSGGIDSSVITAIAAARVDRPIQTFSIGFAENRFNELPFARLVAEKYQTRHVEEVVSPDAAALIDQLCWHYDEPFADSSAVPTMLVSKLASQHVKVVLSGDGGDEAFGGYERYVHDLREGQIRRRLPTWVRRGVLGPLSSAWPNLDWLPRYLRAKSTLTNLSLDDAAAYAHTLTACRPPLRRRLLSPDVRRFLNGYRPEDRMERAYQLGKGDGLAGMISADMASFLPDDYLVKVDRASMAFGLEVRPPLLDHELLELSARIPSSLKVRGVETKWIFKQACGDLLPPELLTRPKQGFEIPINEWMRGPLQPMFRDLVLSPQGPVATMLDIDVVRQLFEQHASNRRRLGGVLWSLMVLARWSSMFLGKSAVRPAVA